MSDGEMKIVPKKPISVAMDVLADNGYKPVDSQNPDIRKMGIFEWHLPGSDTTLGIKQEGTQVVVLMNFSIEKKSALLEGGSIPPSFTVRNMGDLMDFAKDFVKHAQESGIQLPNEFAAKKQKMASD